MSAPDPPGVWWCARTGELATDYTAGMVYLDEHHVPPGDAVRLVPETAQVGRCGSSPPRLVTRHRLGHVPVCTLPAGHAGFHRDADRHGAEWGRIRYEDDAVAALLARCDEADAQDGDRYGWIDTDTVRALLGRADNNGGHEYLSTACHHRRHDDCRRTCKFCATPCRCACHDADEETPDA